MSLPRAPIQHGLDPVHTRDLQAALRTADPSDRLQRLLRLGELDVAVRQQRALLRTKDADPTQAHDLAVVLLVRNQSSGDVGDLLEAAEILLASDAEIPACNRRVVLERLHLENRAAAVVGCPASSSLPGPRSPIGGGRRSADRLPEVELARVRSLDEEDPELPIRIRRHAQAWRTFLERQGLARHLRDRDAAAASFSWTRMAELYSEAAGNPQIAAVYRHLDQTPPEQLPRLEAAISDWLEGDRRLAEFEPEAAEPLLARSREVLSALGSPLEPIVALAAAGCRFRYGDNASMAAIARRVRDRNDLSQAPWVHARANWLEAVTRQGDADWEASLALLGSSADLFHLLGEDANAGYVRALEGIALEALSEPWGAEKAYFDAIGRLARARETRLLAGALSLFARQQGTSGRPRLGAEIQQESLLLHSADGKTELVVEAETLLAERLLQVERPEEAKEALDRAEALADKIVSDASRARSLALLGLVRAQVLLADDPRQAIAALTRHLDLFEAYQEKFYRVQSLWLRARASMALGDVGSAEWDLELGLREIRTQSGRIDDSARAVVFLDRAREALDDRVALDLKKEGDPWAAVSWIERMRAAQLWAGAQGLEGGAVRPFDADALDPNVCLTVYHTLPDQLVAWTVCGGGRKSVDTVRIDQEELLLAVAELRSAGRVGDLTQIRDAARPVSRTLLRPLGNLLSESLYWIVIPDSNLSNLPFAFLLGPDDRFLVEDIAISVAPSMSILERRSSVAELPAPILLAFGDPELPHRERGLSRLPGAAVEARAAAAVFDGSLAFLGPDATGSRFLELADSYDILHLAAHVTPASRTPFGARLILAPDSHHDGRLKASNILALDFSRPQLAVVAGCASGSGFRSQLAGSLDLARAFVIAGVPDVVAALWDIEDRALEAILPLFYEHLSAGHPPAAALRAAQLERLRIARESGIRDPGLAVIEIFSSRIPTLGTEKETT